MTSGTHIGFIKKYVTPAATRLGRFRGRLDRGVLQSALQQYGDFESQDSIISALQEAGILKPRFHGRIDSLSTLQEHHLSADINPAALLMMEKRLAAELEQDIEIARTYAIQSAAKRADLSGENPQEVADQLLQEMQMAVNAPQAALISQSGRTTPILMGVTVALGLGAAAALSLAGTIALSPIIPLASLGYFTSNLLAKKFANHPSSKVRFLARTTAATVNVGGLTALLSVASFPALPFLPYAMISGTIGYNAIKIGYYLHKAISKRKEQQVPKKFSDILFSAVFSGTALATNDLYTYYRLFIALIQGPTGSPALLQSGLGFKLMLAGLALGNKMQYGKIFRLSKTGLILGSAGLTIGSLIEGISGNIATALSLPTSIWVLWADIHSFIHSRSLHNHQLRVLLKDKNAPQTTAEEKIQTCRWDGPTVINEKAHVPEPNYFTSVFLKIVTDSHNVAQYITENDLIAYQHKGRRDAIIKNRSFRPIIEAWFNELYDRVHEPYSEFANNGDAVEYEYQRQIDLLQELHNVYMEMAGHGEAPIGQARGKPKEMLEIMNAKIVKKAKDEFGRDPKALEWDEVCEVQCALLERKARKFLEEKHELERRLAQGADRGHLRPEDLRTRYLNLLSLFSMEVVVVARKESNENANEPSKDPNQGASREYFGDTVYDIVTHDTQKQFTSYSWLIPKYIRRRNKQWDHLDPNAKYGWIPREQAPEYVRDNESHSRLIKIVLNDQEGTPYALVVRADIDQNGLRLEEDDLICLDPSRMDELQQENPERRVISIDEYNQAAQIKLLRIAVPTLVDRPIISSDEKAEVYGLRLRDGRVLYLDEDRRDDLAAQFPGCPLQSLEEFNENSRIKISNRGGMPCTFIELMEHEPLEAFFDKLQVMAVEEPDIEHNFDEEFLDTRTTWEHATRIMKNRMKKFTKFIYRVPVNLKLRYRRRFGNPKNMTDLYVMRSNFQVGFVGSDGNKYEIPYGLEKMFFDGWDGFKTEGKQGTLGVVKAYAIKDAEGRKWLHIIAEDKDGNRKVHTFYDKSAFKGGDEGKGLPSYAAHLPEPENIRDQVDAQTILAETLGLSPRNFEARLERLARNHPKKLVEAVQSLLKIDRYGLPALLAERYNLANRKLRDMFPDLIDELEVRERVDDAEQKKERLENTKKLKDGLVKLFEDEKIDSEILASLAEAFGFDPVQFPFNIRFEEELDRILSQNPRQIVEAATRFIDGNPAAADALGKKMGFKAEQMAEEYLGKINKQELKDFILDLYQNPAQLQLASMAEVKIEVFPEKQGTIPFVKYGFRTRDPEKVKNEPYVREIKDQNGDVVEYEYYRFMRVEDDLHWASFNREVMFEEVEMEEGGRTWTTTRLRPDVKMRLGTDGLLRIKAFEKQTRHFGWDHNFLPIGEEEDRSMEILGVKKPRSVHKGRSSYTVSGRDGEGNQVLEVVHSRGTNPIKDHENYLGTWYDRRNNRLVHYGKKKEENYTPDNYDLTVGALEAKATKFNDLPKKLQKRIREEYGETVAHYTEYQLLKFYLTLDQDARDQLIQGSNSLRRFDERIRENILECEIQPHEYDWIDFSYRFRDSNGRAILRVFFRNQDSRECWHRDIELKGEFEKVTRDAFQDHAIQDEMEQLLSIYRDESEGYIASEDQAAELDAFKEGLNPHHLKIATFDMAEHHKADGALWGKHWSGKEDPQKFEMVRRPHFIITHSSATRRAVPPNLREVLETTQGKVYISHVNPQSYVHVRRKSDGREFDVPVWERIDATHLIDFEHHPPTFEDGNMLLVISPQHIPSGQWYDRKRWKEGYQFPNSYGRFDQAIFYSEEVWGGYYFGGRPPSWLMERMRGSGGNIQSGNSRILAVINSGTPVTRDGKKLMEILVSKERAEFPGQLFVSANEEPGSITEDYLESRTGRVLDGYETTYEPLIVAVGGDVTIVQVYVQRRRWSASVSIGKRRLRPLMLSNFLKAKLPKLFGLNPLVPDIFGWSQMYHELAGCTWYYTGTANLGRYLAPFLYQVFDMNVFRADENLFPPIWSAYFFTGYFGYLYSLAKTNWRIRDGLVRGPAIKMGLDPNYIEMLKYIQMEDVGPFAVTSLASGEVDKKFVRRAIYIMALNAVAVAIGVNKMIKGSQSLEGWYDFGNLMNTFWPFYNALLIYTNFHYIEKEQFKMYRDIGNQLKLRSAEQTLMQERDRLSNDEAALTLKERKASLAEMADNMQTTLGFRHSADVSKLADNTLRLFDLAFNLPEITLNFARRFANTLTFNRIPGLNRPKDWRFIRPYKIFEKKIGHTVLPLIGVRPYLRKKNRLEKMKKKINGAKLDDARSLAELDKIQAKLFKLANRFHKKRASRRGELVKSDGLYYTRTEEKLKHLRDIEAPAQARLTSLRNRVSTDNRLARKTRRKLLQQIKQLAAVPNFSADNVAALEEAYIGEIRSWEDKPFLTRRNFGASEFAKLINTTEAETRRLYVEKHAEIQDLWKRMLLLPKTAVETVEDLFWSVRQVPSGIAAIFRSDETRRGKDDR